MGIRKEDECFPRGRSSTSKPALRKPKDTLFKKHKQPKKKIKKKNSFAEAVLKKSKDQTKQFVALAEHHDIKPLSHENIEEGMVVVGRVRDVFSLQMTISLPGRIMAKVSATAISEPYTESLAKLRVEEINQQECPPLNQIFQPGQSVICAVDEVKRNGDHITVSVTLDPARVNSDRGHYKVQAGQILWAAVGSQEDHGYVLHTGIQGLTAFLKHQNAAKYIKHHNNGRPLVIGEVVRCLVTKCFSGKSSTRALVSLDPVVMARAIETNVTADSLLPGTTVHCKVQQVMPAGLVVSMGKVKGYIEPAQLENVWSAPRHYETGTEVTASILYLLPSSGLTAPHDQPYLTLRDIGGKLTPAYHIGKNIRATVVTSNIRGVFICFGDEKDTKVSNRGFISYRRLGVDTGKDKITNLFPRGKEVTTKILAFDYMEQVYICSCEKDKLEQCNVRAEDLHVGDRVSCKVTAVEEVGLKLSLSSVRLFAFKEHTMDVPCTDLKEHFAPGDIVDARVLKKGANNILVTLKETLIRSAVLASYEDATVGSCYWGTVRRLVLNGYAPGAVVTFYNNVRGLLRLDKLCLETQSFSEGQLVKCYVRYVNATDEKLLLSLEPLEGAAVPNLELGTQYELVVTGEKNELLTVSVCDHLGKEGIIPKCHLPNPEQIKEGDFIKAFFYFRIKENHFFSPDPAIQDFVKSGVNVKPLNKMTCCVNMCRGKNINVYTPLSEIPTAEIPKKGWLLENPPKKHQIVQLYVKSVDIESKTLVLTYVKPEKAETISKEHVKKSKKKIEHQIINEDEEQSKILHIEENTVDKEPKKSKKRKLKESETLKKSTLSEIGFFWDAKPGDLNSPAEDAVDEVEEDMEDLAVGKKRKTVAERRRTAKEEEARLREVENTLLQSESNPQSADQFDRTVLARPDDADLWIKYMSHHLQATEIEKARAVARRALQTINQRHELERLNVWIALLNLEHLFGTQESLKNTFDEALRSNDEFMVYSKMLKIYSEAKKCQEAEQMVNTMIRKFRSSTVCWEQSCAALMDVQLADKARNLLQKAITALPVREHVNLLCKFALLENLHGFSEQAQTLFEHILTSYPKRIDVWNVYVDMLIKSEKVNVARQILERATRQKLPPRKMKMLFSKWVSFEEKHGTPEKVTYVRNQALDYVNNITKGLD